MTQYEKYEDIVTQDRNTPSGGNAMPAHSYASIWKTLSAINVNEHTEKKGNLTYLSWAWAWGTLMEHYPEAEYETNYQERADGVTGIMVGAKITIGQCSRFIWLPVMDYKNKAIEQPTTRDVSDAMMRCLVKCMAMFGLGFYIYAGEDIPQATPQTNGNPRQPSSTTLGLDHGAWVQHWFEKSQAAEEAYRKKDMLTIWTQTLKNWGYDRIDDPEITETTARNILKDWAKNLPGGN